MADLQGTLDAIAEFAVHRCGHCDVSLSPDAPSPDFCGPLCQRAWTEQQAEIVELTGYREPIDVPEHQANLVELSSPETTPAWTPCPCSMCTRFWIRVTDDTPGAERAEVTGYWPLTAGAVISESDLGAVGLFQVMAPGVSDNQVRAANPPGALSEETSGAYQQNARELMAWYVRRQLGMLDVFELGGAS
jgi:hypothetical protein